MAKKACKNCARVMSIVKEGCCFVCVKAAEGLDGEEKAAALAAIKERIDSGGLKKVGHGRRKAGVSAPEKGAAADKERVSIGRERLPDIQPTHSSRVAVHLDEIPSLADIPVRIRLMLEISVHVMPVAA